MKFVSNLLASLLSFLTNKKGAIAIESAFVFIGFFLVLIIAVDFGAVLLQQEKLERVNHSLASVLRERETLYSNNHALTKYEAEIITQDDVDKLRSLAVNLLGKDDVIIKVEQLHFQETATEKIVDDTKSGTLTSGSLTTGECSVETQPITELASFSQWTSFSRWMPLYRVTICMPGESSMFKQIFYPKGADKIATGLTVSNLVVPR